MKRSPKPSFPTKMVRDHWTWIFFIHFAVVNAILSYTPLPLVGKLWIGLLGFALPFFFILRDSLPPKAGSPSYFSGKSDLGIPGWAVLLVLALGLGLRVYRPMTFISWPLFDETINAYYALRLDQKWTWDPFFFYSQLPPLYIWTLTLFYKGMDSFLTALRILPILLSLLILALAYPATRVFFPRNLAFLFLGFSALSFPLLFFGRLSHQGLLMLAVQFLGFFCLGRTLTAGKKGAPWWHLGTGLCVGIGFSTYFSWILVALFITIILVLRSRPLWVHRRTLGWFFAGVTLPLLPLIWAALDQGYGHYFGLLWSFQAGQDPASLVQVTASCLSAFLWGHAPDFFSYGPVWGGFLNPVLGSLFILGALELWRHRRSGTSKAIAFGILLFLAPAFLSKTLTNMREIQVLPLLLLVAGVGCLRLLETTPKVWGKVALTTLLTIIPLLDLVHLEKASSFIDHKWGTQGTAERKRAFGILEEAQRALGPGWILTSFSNDTYTFDRSILTSTYHFNALRNRRLDRSNAGWVGMVTNIHFEPFLRRTFPQGKWFRLSPSIQQESDLTGGLMLAILPRTEGTKRVLEDWVRADETFSRMADQAMDLPATKGRRGTLEALEGMEEKLTQDPFVRSIYWEMVYFNHSWENLFGDKNKAVHFPAALRALHKAIQEGYPTAYFYNELGTLLAFQGDQKGSLEAFQKSLNARLELTETGKNLTTLEPPAP